MVVPLESTETMADVVASARIATMRAAMVSLGVVGKGGVECHAVDDTSRGAGSGWRVDADARGTVGDAPPRFHWILSTG